MIEAWIAVVGSLDATRPTLTVRNSEAARAAAKSIGQALAEHSCGIVVYSSDPHFVEADVVAGFTSSDHAQPESIRVIYARKSPQPVFKEQQLKPGSFKFKIDANSNWEVSFYRSLYGVDGILLVGGGQSSLVAGLFAVIRNMPVIALEAFGGASSSVWELLTPGETLTTEDEKNLMAQEGTTAAWAGKIVDSLLNQRKRKTQALALQEEVMRASRRSVIIQASSAVACLGLALALFVFSWDAEIRRITLLAALITAPALAGAAASVIRTVWERITDDSGVHRSPWLMALLGSVAGAVSGLLYAVAQLTALLPGDHGKLAPMASRLVPFALLTGFLTGFATDAFFRRIRDRETVVEMPAFKLPVERR